MAASRRDSKGRPVVAVTGMGIVTPLGTGKVDNWKKLTAGESGIRTITRFPTDGLRTTISGAVDHVFEEGMHSAALSEKLALLAGTEAIARIRHRLERQFSGTLLSRLPADRDRMAAALRAGERFRRQRQDRIWRPRTRGGKAGIPQIL